MGSASKIIQAAAGNAGAAPGEAIFTTTGSNTWVAPDGVTSVSVVAIGAGGRNYNNGAAGSGAGLGYKNEITVTPGDSYTVYVGAARTGPDPGEDSYFINTSTVKGGGGNYGVGYSTIPGGTFVGDGGGNGGVGGGSDGSYFGGGGGAGGYSGTGGAGAYGNNSTNGGSGAGGGGGGGFSRKGGGGVGIFGQGSSGSGGTSSTNAGGGSGGDDANGESGGLYGGGAIGDLGGGQGAVRIVWGSGRSFPSTDIDQTSSEDIYINNVLQ